MKRRLAILSAFAFACAAASGFGADTPGDLVRADEAQRIASFERASQFVVCIYDQPVREGGGSGVIIDPAGYGLTNFHVVAEMMGTRRGYGGLANGKLYPLRVLGVDPGGDIAMFKLEGQESFPAATLADSDQLRIGQWAAAMGNPFLLAEDYSPTITLGVISGLHRYQSGEGNMLEYADCIQVSTSINPGNSGGPLFDLGARVIGINGRGSFEERGRVNVGLGYAVTINQVKRFLPALRAGRLVSHGTLGVTVQPAGSDLIISAIQQLSPAEKAGLRLGDVLLEAGGKPLRTANEFNNAIAILPEKWPVALRYRRGDGEQTTTARLEKLSVKVGESFVPDLAVNHAEIRRFFAPFAVAAGAGVVWSAKITPTVGGTAVAFPVTMRWNATGNLRIGLAVANAPPEVEISGATGDGDAAATWNNVAVWKEWLRVIAPLLAGPELTPSWEVVGGDDVEGHIVSVVENRGDGGAIGRWKFDFFERQLLQATLGTRDTPDAVVWSCAGDRISGESRWPRKWTRTVGNETTCVIEIDSLAVTTE